MGERVFDGLKVLDCATFIAGPAAAPVMSDFGAEVIKIEPRGTGEPYRRRATPRVGPGLPSNPDFVLDGRNEKSLAPGWSPMPACSSPTIRRPSAVGLLSILATAGLIFGIVADMDEIADDAQILASEALVPSADGSR
ncbi:MAG TPA: CoA transferase [Stellaceae bacterium]|nr:CoA transferase [Stellaceae bacterium]